MSGSDLSGYTSYEIADDSYFETVKGYWPDGKIRIKCVMLGSIIYEFRIGKEYRYDKMGRLNYAVASDEHFDFTFEQVLEYLLEEEKVPLKPGKTWVGDYSLESVNRLNPHEDNRSWEIIWNMRDPAYGVFGKQIVLVLDGKTGEVVSRTEQEAPIMKE